MLSQLLRPPRLRTTTLEEGGASDPRHGRMELLSLARSPSTRYGCGGVAGIRI